MCEKHEWVNTGMTWTFCKQCNANGDWVGQEVVLRRPGKVFAHNLEFLGVPIEFNSYKAKDNSVSGSLEIFDVWVSKSAGELESGNYINLVIERSLIHPNRLLVMGAEIASKVWASVPCNDGDAFDAYVKSIS